MARSPVRVRYGVCLWRWMKRPASRSAVSGWSRCGECPQSGQLEQAGLRHAARDAADLLERAVLVVLALHREHRAGDRCRSRPRCSSRGTAGAARCRSSPRRPSRGRRGSAPGARAGRSSQVGRRAPSRCSRPTRPRRRCAAPARRAPATRSGSAPRAAARSSRRRCGRTARAAACACRSAVEQRRQHLVRLAVHEVDVPALVGGARRRAAVAGARIHQAAHAGGVAEALRESPPHRERAEAFVQEDDQRRVARARGRASAYSMRTRRPRQSMSTNSAGASAQRLPRLALAQPEALDLAGGGLRQLVDELDRRAGTCTARGAP